MLCLKLEDVFDIKTETDIDNLVKLVDASLQKRLKEDYLKGYFEGFFITEPGVSYEKKINSVISYVLHYNSYSTWQSRVLYVSELWVKASLDETSRFEVVKIIKEKLFKTARENNFQRINLNLHLTDENRPLCDYLVSPEIGAVNLTASEDWLIFELGENEMKAFTEKAKPKYDDNAFRLIKVEDMKIYGSQIRNLIRELSIYENMEDQFKLDLGQFLADYEHREVASFRKDKHVSRFYEAFVVVKASESGDVVIGFAIYYKNYELKRGRGMYMEDLYIKEEFRGQGLGTALWSKVIEDSMFNFNVNFMQWSVLCWNTSAIGFYYKYKSLNLTDINKLNLFRFVTENIYSLV